MPHLLDSSIQRIHQAGQHFMELEAAFARAMYGPDGYRAVAEHDPEGREVIVRARLPAKLPARWGAMIAEPFDRMRSCLDQLARALVLVSDGQPDNRTAFPIARNEADFRTAVELKLRGVTPEIQAVVESLQPFRTGSAEPETEPLWILHELSAIPSHRLLRDVEISLVAGEFRPSVSPDVEVETVFVHAPGPVEDRDVLAQFRASALTDAPMSVQVNCTFEITFQPRVLPTGMPVYGVLQDLIMHVHYVVLPAFAEFFPKYPTCSELDHPPALQPQEAPPAPEA